MDRNYTTVVSSPAVETRRPFEQSSTLPGEFYHSSEILSAELDRIFARTWIAVGREEDISEPGSYFTREIGRESIVLLRDDGGEPRAFFNVCRHRGANLLESCDGARLTKIQCPYHAWTYGLDGRLAAAPLMESTPGFSKDDYPPVPAKVETWEGFLFVNLDVGAGPLERQLAGFPDISRFQLPRLRRGGRIAYDVAANWKLIGENYNECYHCALAHPQPHRISHYQSGGRTHTGLNFTGGPMTLNEGFKTMTMSGKSTRPPIPDLDPEDHRTVHYFHLYPGLLLSLHPDYVLTHTVWPVDTSRSRVICEWLFTQDAMGREDFDGGDAIEFWDVTNRQDWELCGIAQKGVQSRGYRPGRYQAGESSVHAFDNWYLGQLER